MTFPYNSLAILGSHGVPLAARESEKARTFNTAHCHPHND